MGKKTDTMIALSEAGLYNFLKESSLTSFPDDFCVTHEETVIFSFACEHKDQIEEILKKTFEEDAESFSLIREERSKYGLSYIGLSTLQGARGRSFTK